MRKHYWWAAAGLVAFAAAAQPARDIFAQIGVEIQGPLKELTALEEEEKKLRTSEQAQIFASEAEKKERARVEREITQLKLEGEQADQMRQRTIDSGCPEHGGEVAIEVANRCNPQVRAHRELVERLAARMYSLKSQRDQVDQLRANISATVLANVQKRKQIDADRTRLTAERDRLQGLAIAELIKRNKLGAARACKSECCHRVIYDGADPKQCGIGLVCESFERAGLFGTRNRICTAGPSLSPIVERTQGAAAKPQWEIEYDRKMEEYRRKLAEQQQAVANFERDKAAMERRRAELKAKAEQAQAEWRSRAAACQAGDYAKCN